MEHLKGKLEVPDMVAQHSSTTVTQSGMNFPNLTDPRGSDCLPQFWEGLDSMGETVHSEKSKSEELRC